MKNSAIILLFLCLIGGLSPTIAEQPTIIPGTIAQGKTMEIRLAPLADGEIVTGRFLGDKVSFFKGDDYWRGFVAISLEQKPGKYPLVVTRSGAGGEKEFRQIITIHKGKFPVVSYWLKPSRKKLLNDRQLVNDEWSEVAKVLVVKDPTQRWQGKFSFPLKGETSMVFGVIERINNKPAGRHRGYDIAVPVGTTVYAPNDGKIVFTGRLQAFGNTLVVDHGQGIQTLYFHLSKFLVEVGQTVSRGDRLALSGDTGISSGAHLHWGLSVNDVRVDPVQWTKMEM